jgi:hypothetical protein
LNTHDTIAGKLNFQYRTLADAAAALPKVELPRTPVTPLLAAQTFATLINTCADADAAALLIHADRFGAESFLMLAEYVVKTYSQSRCLTVELFADTGRQFSWLSQLVNCYIREIQSGAPSPFS